MLKPQEKKKKEKYFSHSKIYIFKKISNLDSVRKKGNFNGEFIFQKNVATSWKPKIERNFIKEFVFRKDITFFFSFFFLREILLKNCYGQK